MVLEDVGGEGWLMVSSLESSVWGGVETVEGGRASGLDLVEVDV